MRKYALCISFALSMQTTLAQVVFLSDPYELTIYNKTLSSSSHMIITKKEIRESTVISLSQLLSQKAGLNIINGSLNSKSYYLRGGDSSHILILIDEMPIYDALATARSFSLESLNKSNIQKIEIIKGSQTAVYGGQALVAVIKITTVKSDLDKTKTLLKLNVGEQASARAEANHQILKDNTIYQIAASGGTNEARSPIPGSDITYPNKKQSVDLAIINNNDLGQVLMKFSHFEDRRHIVNRDVDATNYIAKNNYELWGLKLVPKLAYLPKISYSIVNSERLYSYPVNALNTLEIDQRYYGKLNILSMEKDFKFDTASILLGHQQTYEAGDIQNIKGQNPALNEKYLKVNSRLLGTYFLLKKNIDTSSEITGGVRYNNFDDGRHNNQFQFGFRYKKFKIEYAEGHKSPTLFNLYDINYGNSNLKSEKAQTLTTDYEIQEHHNHYSISLFYVQFTNLINASRNSVGSFQYLNIGQAEVAGVDLGYSRSLVSADVRFNMTYQQPKDKVTNDWLDRRPFLIGSFFYNYKWTDKLSTNFDLYMNSKRKDKTFAGLATLSEFWVYNTSLIYKINHQEVFYFKILNIFNIRYEESVGYLSDGRHISMEYEFQF